MMPAQLPLILKTFLGLFFIWYVMFFLVRDHVIDQAREQLFALRDELFNYVTAIGMDYDDPRHVTLRRCINSTIRFTHKLTIIRLAVTILLKERYPSMYHYDQMGAWKDSLDSLPSDQRDKLFNIFARAMQIALHQMLWRSSWVFPFAAVYKLASATNAAISKRLRQYVYENIRNGLHEQALEDAYQGYGVSGETKIEKTRSFVSV